MEETDFDRVARDELHALEEAFTDVDPDDVEVSTSEGVLRMDLRDGTKIVINSHRAARQIWMAAVATAWHFDPIATTNVEGTAPPPGDNGVTWRASKTGEELRPTLARLLRERVGVSLPL
jgi:CyaY protein